MKKYLAGLLMLMSTMLYAQNQYAYKEFVIVKSTKSYAEANRYAGLAAEKTGFKKDLRGQSFHKATGLTGSQTECEENGYEYPFYFERGLADEDQGAYVSIEYTNSYECFAKGYYIVVVACADPGTSLIKNTLTKAKAFFPDAYVRHCRLFTGCDH